MTQHCFFPLFRWEIQRHPHPKLPERDREDNDAYEKNTSKWNKYNACKKLYQIPQWGNYNKKDAQCCTLWRMDALGIHWIPEMWEYLQWDKRLSYFVENCQMRHWIIKPGFRRRWILAFSKITEYVFGLRVSMKATTPESLWWDWLA